MKNKKLVYFMAFIVVIMLIVVAGTVFAVNDNSKYINEAFKNLDETSFNDLCIEIEDDGVLVFSNKDGVIYNPLDLDYSSVKDTKLNVNPKLIKGRDIRVGDKIEKEGRVEDTKAFIGKEVDDMKVYLEVNINTKTVQVLSISYIENGLEVKITANKK